MFSEYPILTGQQIEKLILNEKDDILIVQNAIQVLAYRVY